MTPAATPEALEQARRIADEAANHPMRAASEYARRTCETSLQAVTGSVTPGPQAEIDALRLLLTTAETSLQRVTAERDEARAENDRFRAGLANGSGPCVYCDLSREDWAKCQSGFPGCSRADDAMLCPHFGAEMEANDRTDTATAEAPSLRAKVEALTDVLKQIDGAGLRIRLTHELGDAVRTVLALAATAGEGRSDG